MGGVGAPNALGEKCRHFSASCTMCHTLFLWDSMFVFALQTNFQLFPFFWDVASSVLVNMFSSAVFTPRVFFARDNFFFWGQVGVHFSTDTPLIGMSLPLRTIFNTEKRLVTFLCNFSPPPMF